MPSFLYIDVFKIPKVVYLLFLRMHSTAISPDNLTRHSLDSKHFFTPFREVFASPVVVGGGGARGGGGQ